MLPLVTVVDAVKFTEGFPTVTHGEVVSNEVYVCILRKKEMPKRFEVEPQTIAAITL